MGYDIDIILNNRNLSYKCFNLPKNPARIMNINISIIPNTLIICWGIWYAIVAITDMISLLNYTNLSNIHRFDSENVARLVAMFQRHGWNHYLCTLLLMSMVTITCFFTSFCMFYGLYNRIYFHSLFWVDLGFAASIGLHFIFVIVQEFFVHYEHIDKHITRLNFILITYYFVSR